MRVDQLAAFRLAFSLALHVLHTAFALTDLRDRTSKDKLGFAAPALADQHGFSSSYSFLVFLAALAASIHFVIVSR